MGNSVLTVSGFFKQKTAYEMRESDWSSDVCSSDLMKDGDRAGLSAFNGDSGVLTIEKNMLASNMNSSTSLLASFDSLK